MWHTARKITGYKFSLMAANEIHDNDIGTVITLTVRDGGTVVDVSSATVTKNILLRSPTGTLSTNGASFTTNGTDGKIKYTTVTGDLDVVGTWDVQAHVVITAGTFRSDIKKFEVHRNLS